MNKSTSERVLKCTRERSEVSPPLLGAPQFRSCWGREPRFANIWQREHTAQQRSKAQTIQRVSLIRISLKWLSSHTSPFIKTLCRLSYITSQSTNGYGLRQLLQVDGFFDWMNQPTTLTSSRSHLSNLVINQQPTGFNIVRLLLSVNVQGAV